jgi:hypothetical protein
MLAGHLTASLRPPVSEWPCHYSVAMNGSVLNLVSIMSHPSASYIGITKICVPYLQFLISNLRSEVTVVSVHLGDSPASELNMPTFRNTLFHRHGSCEKDL